MLQTTFLEGIAQLLRESADLKEFRLGESNQPPTPEDGGLIGTQLLTVNGTVSQLGNTVTLEVVGVPFQDDTAQECGVFNSTGQLLDRMVLPRIKGETGALLNFRYTLEVIDDGAA